MKLKLNKIIKYILVFTSVFLLSFGCFCFTSLGAENDSLKFSFYSKPVLQVWDGTDWVISDIGSISATASTDGQDLKLSVEPYTEGFVVGKFYRVFIRFRLEGDFLYKTACNFDMRFTSGSGSIGSATGSYNPNSFKINNSKKSQSYGNIWFKDGDFAKVTDSATLESFTVTERTCRCEGYRYSFPTPSLKYNIQAFQIGYGFIVNSNQINRVEIVMENFNFPLSLPDFSGESLNEFEEMESGIIDSTQDGRDGAISIFNSFGGNLHTFDSGIVAVGSVINEFFQISKISTIVNIGLSLGLFAFVVGMSIYISKRK